MNDFVYLPALLFLPWFVSLFAITRWRRYAEPGDPMAWTARAGVTGCILCAVVIGVVAIRTLGAADWFVLMILAWIWLSRWLYRQLMIY